MPKRKSLAAKRTSNASQNGMTGCDSRSWVMLRIGR
jgi:hypothetical protein